MAAVELIVQLHGAAIGSLSRNDDDSTEFRLFDAYKEVYPRPVLGQRFLDEPNRVWRSRSRVPDWFSNLLPEGALREMVARQAGVVSSRELFLLRHLGEDLPGAVRISAEPISAPEDGELGGERRAAIDRSEEWHFSLAGVQLKFSARRDERGLTIPVSGVGGDWIVKLPDLRYAGVPENEFATMSWARDSGIDVPNTELLDLSDVSGLPAEARSLKERQVYAIRRFDRASEGRRVHIEDFAQVLGLYPEEKYARFNYETIANVVAVLAGDEDLQEFLRRLVFVVASGNGDAHHKNWSLIYPDGMTARLSPAYDLVSTIQYIDNDQLALNLARSKRWQDVSMGSFRRLARKLQRPEPAIERMTQEAVEAIIGAWSRSKAEYGYTAAGVERIDRHLSTIPLFNPRSSA